MEETQALPAGEGAEGRAMPSARKAAAMLAASVPAALAFAWMGAVSPQVGASLPRERTTVSRREALAILDLGMVERTDAWQPAQVRWLPQDAAAWTPPYVRMRMRDGSLRFAKAEDAGAIEAAASRRGIPWSTSDGSTAAIAMACLGAALGAAMVATAANGLAAALASEREGRR